MERVSAPCRSCHVARVKEDPDGYGSAFDAAGAHVCRTCARRFPPSLLKCAVDTFIYACRLETGEMLMVQECTIDGDWVHLKMLESGVWGDAYDKTLPPFERGVDVRLSAIVWFADAPYGS